MHYQSPRLDTNTNDHWHLDTFGPFSYQYYDSGLVLIKSRKVRGEEDEDLVRGIYFRMKFSLVRSCYLKLIGLKILKCIR